MKQGNVLMLIGITSIVLAYLPVYPNVISLIGLIIGLIGIILGSRFIKRVKTQNKYLKIGRIVCIIGTIVSALMFTYASSSII